MTLLEQNKATLKKCIESNPEIKALRETIMKKTGKDPIFNTEEFPFASGNFSFKKIEERLQEADMASSFTQFLRAGLMQIVNSMYESVPVTYNQWATVVQSSKDTEIYAPMHGIGFPRQVGVNEKFPQTGAAALDLEIKNKKFGVIYAVQKELLNDDQSGQFTRQAGMLGEYMALIPEVYAYGKLASVSNMKYLDLDIPTCETKPSYEASFPWATALKGGGATKGTLGLLNQANIQAGLTGLYNQKNLQGIKMGVLPDKLIIGPALQWDASVLLHSAYFPTVTATGGTGSFMSENPIKGILDLVVSRFVAKNDGSFNGDSKAWYIVDSKKPFFVVQMREPVSVVQETPNTGLDFEMDQVRFRASSRLNCDFVDPRFAWQGNDGSVV